MTTAMVLSAGGVAGWAYHAGVLTALRDQAGIAAEDSTLVIGTSAGSAIAAAVRAGVPPEEMLRPVRTPPTPEQRDEMMDHVRKRRRQVRLLEPSLTRRAMRNGSGWLLAASGMLPDGFFPTWGLSRFPGVLDHDEWPSGLYIPSVSVDAAARVVFGRDTLHVSVGDAVEASSAVPGMFQPKVIDGRRFVDGGTMSGTHADLALDVEPELVIISSLITRPALRPTSRFARSSLRQELDVLNSAGVRTLVVEPRESHSGLLKGFPRRHPERLADILHLARSDTERALQASNLRAS